MKVLYPSLYLSTQLVREQKKVFLARFMIDGFYLIDAVENPIGKVSPAIKRKRIRESLPSLIERLDGELGSQSDTPILLISAPVFDICDIPLSSVGYNVLNRELIDFPASGRQQHFRRKLRQVLAAHNLLPSGL